MNEIDITDIISQVFHDTKIYKVKGIISWSHIDRSNVLEIKTTDGKTFIITTQLVPTDGESVSLDG